MTLVLVALAVDGGDRALGERVAERGIDGGGGDLEAGGGFAVDGEGDLGEAESLV